MSKNLPRANKDLGQHFLNDPKVISKITEDFKENAKNIIEVGPGPGILTKNLAAHKMPMHVIEKDKRMVEYLGPILQEDKINFTDALQINFSEFIQEKSIDDNLWLVSNLPYNISTPLLMKFLKTPEIKYMTLMFQKEVADKVFAFSTKKNFMGSLMGLSQTYFETSLLCKVPPGAFIPPPKVDSAVISFKRIENPIIPIEEIDKLESFLRAVFKFKRKQLGNVLKTYTTSDKLSEMFSKMNILPSVRAEGLTLSQLQQMYLIIKE